MVPVVVQDHQNSQHCTADDFLEEVVRFEDDLDDLVADRLDDDEHEGGGNFSSLIFFRNRL
jgi:hypothetical protein